MSVKNIYILVSNFRQAMEIARENGDFDSYPYLKNFPIASCGDASELLQKFLYENSIVTYYRFGEYRGEDAFDSQSHAWLELLDGEIIDITGDQFTNKPIFLNYSESVFIGLPDEFHKIFKKNQNSIYNTTYDPMIGLRPEKMNEIYDRILSYMN